MTQYKTTTENTAQRLRDRSKVSKLERRNCTESTVIKSQKQKKRNKKKLENTLSPKTKRDKVQKTRQDQVKRATSTGQSRSGWWGDWEGRNRKMDQQGPGRRDEDMKTELGSHEGQCEKNTWQLRLELTRVHLKTRVINLLKYFSIIQFNFISIVVWRHFTVTGLYSLKV